MKKLMDLTIAFVLFAVFVDVNRPGVSPVAFDGAPDVGRLLPPTIDAQMQSGTMRNTTAADETGRQAAPWPPTHLGQMNQFSGAWDNPNRTIRRDDGTAWSPRPGEGFNRLASEASARMRASAEGHGGGP